MLNKVWYSGAYTAQLDSVPTRSLPGNYRIESGTLSAWGSATTGGSDIGLYTPGTTWTDYTMAFDANIVNQQAGWVVRSRDPQNGLVFLLSANNLRAFTAVGNVYTQIASVTTPFAVSPGTWYSISTTVSGSTATVKINGTQVMSVTSSTFGSGSVGFRQYGAEEARFRNLVVTNSSGGQLLNLVFNNASHLTSFRVPGSNEVPSILDGAKRDRLVWSGDLDTAGPTISYSLGNNDYLKGSLRLFATRQHTGGFVEGVVPATYPLINATGLTSDAGWYSSTYSMYFVLGLYDHLMYSGDRAFASSMWSAMEPWQAAIARRVDALVDKHVPGVRKAVRWHCPFYGAAGDGWFLAFAAFQRHVKFTFFKGALLQPPPPVGQVKDTRSLDVREGDTLDEQQLASWIEQAAAIPGWNGS